MAQIVMTDAQKDLLLADPNFAIQVKWSILDQANVTRGLDGTGTFTATSFKQLAQWKPLAASIIGNGDPFTIDPNAPKFFVNQIASENLPYDLAQAWFTQQTYRNPW